MIALAETHIGTELARRVDGEDVAQSVFRTFFRRQKLGEFKIENSVELWSLLVTITLAKVNSQARRHTARRRDVRAECSRGEDLVQQLTSEEPGPVDAAIFVDLLERILDGLPELHAKILSRLMDGMSKVEIAQELEVSRQTVYRVLDVFTNRLEKLAERESF